jgi:hypothetical protein
MGPGWAQSALDSGARTLGCPRRRAPYACTTGPSAFATSSNSSCVGPGVGGHGPTNRRQESVAMHASVDQGPTRARATHVRCGDYHARRVTIRRLTRAVRAALTGWPGAVPTGRKAGSRARLEGRPSVWLLQTAHSFRASRTATQRRSESLASRPRGRAIEPSRLVVDLRSGPLGPNPAMPSELGRAADGPERRTPGVARVFPRCFHNSGQNTGRTRGSR